MKKIIALLIVTLIPLSVHAKDLTDSDNDGLSDYDEIHIYHSNPNLADTDGDGYPDGAEVKNGYSPTNPSASAKLNKIDSDNDGLTDAQEIAIGSDLTKKDTDNNGKSDFEDLYNGFLPSDHKIELNQSIEVNTKTQSVTYFVDKIEVGKFKVSTGKRSTPTPLGNFKIINKQSRAWSKKFGLWMPYWMGIKDGSFGFHELPEWPNGYKEGASHIGRPVSHGCIRLGVGDAKKFYQWAKIGTTIKIY